MSPTEAKKVKIHYRGTLDDGTEFDSSHEREPLEFTPGEGQVIPGFEQAVMSMTVGEQKTVTIPAEEAYGPRHDDAVQSVPRDIFPDEPDPGEIVTLVAPDSSELMATVLEVAEDEVTLDFNHPLAGEPLTFELELMDIG
jgi:peptidylprolyl isomerase